MLNGIKVIGGCLLKFLFNITELRVELLLFPLYFKLVCLFFFPLPLFCLSTIGGTSVWGVDVVIGVVPVIAFSFGSNKIGCPSK